MKPKLERITLKKVNDDPLLKFIGIERVALYPMSMACMNSLRVFLMTAVLLAGFGSSAGAGVHVEDKDISKSEYSESPLIDDSAYARLLETYVSPAGVRYDDWFKNKSDLRALEDFLMRAAEVDLSGHSKTEQTAFYINLYNAAMLQAVFDHYPLESVKDIGFLPFSIFKKDFIRQGDRKLSLDDVEKGILLKDFFDPRIHFAVNCASESCPPLRAEPFVGRKLDAQLTEQTRAFARSDRAARVFHNKKKTIYSELFKWYRDDFPGGDPAEYLNPYRETPLPLDYEVEWIDYDWSLNAAQ